MRLGLAYRGHQESTLSKLKGENISMTRFRTCLPIGWTVGQGREGCIKHTVHQDYCTGQRNPCNSECAANNPMSDLLYGNQGKRDDDRVEVLTLAQRLGHSSSLRELQHRQ